MEPVFVYNFAGCENTRRFRRIAEEGGFTLRSLRFGLDGVTPSKSCIGIYEGRENVGAIDEDVNLLYVLSDGDGALSKSLDALARSFIPR